MPVAAPVLAAKAPPIDWTGYKWAGLYAGGQVGMIWGANHGDYYVATPGGLGADDSLNGDAQVASVEGHVGYNWQYDHAVVGLEGSLLGTNLVKSSLLPVYDPNFVLGPPTTGTPGGTLTTAVKSNLQGSLRATPRLRLGTPAALRHGRRRARRLHAAVLSLGRGFAGPVQRLEQPLLAARRLDARRRRRMGDDAQLGDPRRISLHGFWNRRRRFDLCGSRRRRSSPERVVSIRICVEFGVSYKFGEEGQAPLVVAADLPHLKDAPVVVLPPPGSPWRGFYAGVNAGGVFDAANGQGPTSVFWDPSLPFGSGVNPNLAYIPGGAE